MHATFSGIQLFPFPEISFSPSFHSSPISFPLYLPFFFCLFDYDSYLLRNHCRGVRQVQPSPSPKASPDFPSLVPPTLSPSKFLPQVSRVVSSHPPCKKWSEDGFPIKPFTSFTSHPLKDSNAKTFMITATTRVLPSPSFSRRRAISSEDTLPSHGRTRPRIHTRPIPSPSSSPSPIPTLSLLPSTSYSQQTNTPSSVQLKRVVLLEEDMTSFCMVCSLSLLPSFLPPLPLLSPSPLILF